ncbi:MAG: hypothetical protein AB1782_13800 [Cyanobacteriota bacterium]
MRLFVIFFSLVFSLVILTSCSGEQKAKLSEEEIDNLVLDSLYQLDELNKSFVDTYKYCQYSDKEAEEKDVEIELQDLADIRAERFNENGSEILSIINPLYDDIDAYVKNEAVNDFTKKKLKLLKDDFDLTFNELNEALDAFEEGKKYKEYDNFCSLVKKHKLKDRVKNLFSQLSVLATYRKLEFEEEEKIKSSNNSNDNFDVNADYDWVEEEEQ